MQGRLRELALFDLGIDSKLRACDLLSLRVRDVCHGDRVGERAIVLQQKTQRPVQFEITPSTREVVTSRAEVGRLPLPEPGPRIAALEHTPVRENRRRLGRGNWSRFDGVWHALDAPDQADADLSSDQESLRITSSGVPTMTVHDCTAPAYGQALLSATTDVTHERWTVRSGGG
jgi:hypothetical protein